MNVAKVTLTSTVVAMALGLAFGLMNTPAQAHTTACGTKPDHKHCGGGGGIVYEAELTDGAFVFAPENPVVVTPNQREITLRSDVVLEMIRPDPNTDPDGYLTWNEVFNACEELLGLDTVESFSVGRDDWRIDNNTGEVRVVFRDIELRDIVSNVIEAQGAEVRVQLIGDDNGIPFLPEVAGDMREYDLTEFVITGTPARGKGAIKSCRGTAGGGELGFIDGSGTFIPSPSTLVITASVPE